MAPRSLMPVTMFRIPMSTQYSFLFCLSFSFNLPLTSIMSKRYVSRKYKM